MARGDHIYVHRLGYTHHGIDCGDATVIHYTGEPGDKVAAQVRRTSLGDFAVKEEVHTRSYGQCDPPEAVVARAESRLDERTYSLVFNNCEHFATWCKTGEHRSDQVKNVASVSSGAVGGGAALAGSLGAVSATGAVAGLSGAGIMSGLATVGGIVGGGAVAGVAVLGVAPAAVAMGVMRSVLRDDPILHETERKARKAGRRGTVAGAAGGSAAAIGTIAAAGSVAGLSGPGIAAGLAAIGGAVGGGMTAGVAITIGLPAVAAAALGYGTYRLSKRLRKRRS